MATYKIVKENHNHNSEEKDLKTIFEKYKKDKKYVFDGFICEGQIGEYCIVSHESNNFDSITDIQDFVNLIKTQYSIPGPTGSSLEQIQIVQQCNDFLNKIK